MERFLTLAQADAVSGRSPYTLREDIREGRLPAFRPSGGKLVVRESDLHAFLTASPARPLDGTVPDTEAAIGGAA
jgi:predicted site-specific integrase-resolvase